MIEKDVSYVKVLLIFGALFVEFHSIQSVTTNIPVKVSLLMTLVYSKIIFVNLMNQVYVSNSSDAVLWTLVCKNYKLFYSGHLCYQSEHV